LHYGVTKSYYSSTKLLKNTFLKHLIPLELQAFSKRYRRGRMFIEIHDRMSHMTSERSNIYKNKRFNDTYDPGWGMTSERSDVYKNKRYNYTYDPAGVAYL